jgi:hypothetical protein
MASVHLDLGILAASAVAGDLIAGSGTTYGSVSATNIGNPSQPLPHGYNYHGDDYSTQPLGHNIQHYTPIQTAAILEQIENLTSESGAISLSSTSSTSKTTYTPGVYAGKNVIFGGIVNLNSPTEDGTFVFYSANSLTILDNTIMNIVNETSPSNVYFVSPTITIGNNVSAVGNYISDEDISIGSSVVSGRVLSLGTVTFDNTLVIVTQYKPFRFTSTPGGTPVAIGEDFYYKLTIETTLGASYYLASNSVQSKPSFIIKDILPSNLSYLSTEYKNAQYFTSNNELLLTGLMAGIGPWKFDTKIMVKGNSAGKAVNYADLYLLSGRLIGRFTPVDVNVIAPQSVTITVDVSPKRVSVGSDVVITATLTNGYSPTGTVTFTITRKTYSVEVVTPVVNSEAIIKFSTKCLHRGNYSVVATYSGDSLNQKSQSTLACFTLN